MQKNLPINTPIVTPQYLPTEDFVFFLNDLNKSSATLNDVNATAGMLLKFNFAKTSAYTLFTYSGSQITKIDVYTDSTKVTQLYQQTITYSGSKISGYTLKDLINSKTLTATYSYSGDTVTSKTMTIS